MHLLNNTPSPRRRGLTPNYLFLGEKTSSNFFDDTNSRLYATLIEGMIEQPESPEKVQRRVEKLRDVLEEEREKTYRYVKEQHDQDNQRTASRYHLQFQEGDWVLLSKAVTIRGERKDKPTWVGPYQVVEARAHNIYRIARVDGGRTYIVHSSFLWFYEPNGFTPPPELVEVFLQDYGELEVEKILDCRYTGGVETCKLLVHWSGFPDSSDSWEPFLHIIKYVPDVVRQFVEKQDPVTRDLLLPALKRQRR